MKMLKRSKTRLISNVSKPISYVFVVIFRLKHKKINLKTNNKIKSPKNSSIKNFGLKEIFLKLLGQQKLSKNVG